MASLPENLKKFRHDKRKTQKQVADEVGISQGTYSALEAGRFEPSLPTLRALADYYNTTLDVLTDFVQWIDLDESLTEDEKNWLEHFHDMSLIERSLVLGFISVVQEQRKNPYTYLPLDMNVVDFKEKMDNKYKCSTGDDDI